MKRGDMVGQFYSLRLRSGVIWTSSARITQSILNILNIIIVSYFSTRELAGYYVIISTTLVISTTFCIFGTNIILVKQISRSRNKLAHNLYVSNIFTFVILVTTIASLSIQYPIRIAPFYSTIAPEIWPLAFFLIVISTAFNTLVSDAMKGLH